MRAVKDPDVLDEGDGSALLRVRRRRPDGSCGNRASCKSEKSATGGSTHVSSSSCTIALREYYCSPGSEVHGRPACRIRLSPSQNPGNQRLIQGKASGIPDAR